VTTSLVERLRAALPAAMRARDGAAVTALRSALAAVENAAAVAPQASPFGPAATGLGATEVPRRIVDDAEAREIVRAEVTERLAAAEQYDGHGHADRAVRLRAEADALAAFLDPPT
jgi:hypothetical protein